MPALGPSRHGREPLQAIVVRSDSYRVDSPPFRALVAGLTEELRRLDGVVAIEIPAGSCSSLQTGTRPSD